MMDGNEDKKEEKEEKKNDILRTFEGFNDGTIKIIFELISFSKQSGECNVLLTVYNLSSKDIENFNVGVGGPHYIKIQMVSGNEQGLFKKQSNHSIKLKIINVEYGDEPFMVIIEMKFT